VSWAAIVFTFALVDNVVLSRLLGLPPREALPSRKDTPDRAGSAAWLGGSMAVLMSISAVAAWALDSQLLLRYGFAILRTPLLVFLVAGIALGLQALVGRIAPAVLERAGVSIPRASVNCIVLGFVLVTTRAQYGPLQCFLAGLGAGAGYLLATAMMDAIQERLDVEPVPPALRGMPLQLVTAGLMAYAFMAFDRGFLARLLGG